MLNSTDSISLADLGALCALQGEVRIIGTRQCEMSLVNSAPKMSM